MATPQDGTQLGTGEVLSNEFVDLPGGSRQDPALPPTAYKLPRSKIIVGPYGQDGGDVTMSNPLPAESMQLRRLAELNDLRDREEAMCNLQRYAYDTMPLTDNRGYAFTNRGVR